MEIVKKIFTAMISGTNLPFSLILLSISAICIIILLFKKEKTTFVKQSPNLLVSIGILGTFFGIVIALLGFDGMNNIKNQIDIIIKGMQTAFISSVLGLSLSICIKFIMIFIKDDDINAENITGDDIIQGFILQAQNSNEMIEKMDLLLNAIGSDGDNSMIGQIRLLRSDINDQQKRHEAIIKEQLIATKQIQTQQENILNTNKSFFEKLEQKLANQLEYSNQSLQVLLKSYQDKKSFEEKLWKELNQVTETLSKSATEAIIQALKDVISDFNKNLTEQFGENFKELNRAVFKLVEWQENYKQQIKDMTTQYTLGVQAIDNTKTAVNSIEQSAKSIPNLISDLGIIITDNQAKLNELSKHLQAFSDMRDKAVDTLPQIQSHITLVLDNMQKGSKEIETTMNNIANTFTNNTKQSLDNINTLSQTIKERTQNIDNELQNVVKHIEQGVNNWLKNFENAIKNLQSEFERSLLQATNEQKELVRVQMRDLVENSQKSYQDMQNDINKILNDTQTNMGKAQEKAISDMGKSLVSITGQFANDYTRLTQEMDKVIRQYERFR